MQIIMFFISLILQFIRGEDEEIFNVRIHFFLQILEFLNEN